MSLYNNASIASAGLYSQTLEAMMYSPPSITSIPHKNQGFKDENLEKKSKKVSRLVEKFETCNLDETIDDVMEKLAEIEKIEKLEEYVPVPKPRTIRNVLKVDSEEVTSFKMAPEAATSEWAPRLVTSLKVNSESVTTSKMTSEFHTPSEFVSAVTTPSRTAPESTLPSKWASKSMTSSEAASRVVTSSEFASEFATFSRTTSKLITSSNMAPQPSTSSKYAPEPLTLSEMTPESSPDLTSEDIEDFYHGIQKTSSPIPESPKVFHDMVKTPILTKSKFEVRPLNFGILDQNIEDVTTPKGLQACRPKPGSTCSSVESTTSTASSMSTSSTPEELDIYLKIARAHIHKEFAKYYKWESETLRTIAIHVSAMRLDALNSIPNHLKDSKIDNMITIYEKCLTGHATKEMDALACSIFHLMENHIHEKKISIYEEYVVRKYSNKLMN